MKTVLITAPTIYPITIDELRLYLRIDDATGYEDDLLDNIISAATRNAEDITRRALLTQTWDYYLDSFPSTDAFKLPFGNLQTTVGDVSYIKYTNSAGTQTTMTLTTDYLVETNGEQCGRIVLPYGASWPSFTPYPSHPIVVRFICGWTTAALVPFNIKAAILLICADMYSVRAQKIMALNMAENKTTMNLLMSSRLWDEF